MLFAALSLSIVSLASVAEEATVCSGLSCSDDESLIDMSLMQYRLKFHVNHTSEALLHTEQDSEAMSETEKRSEEEKPAEDKAVQEKPGEDKLAEEKTSYACMSGYKFVDGSDDVQNDVPHASLSACEASCNGKRKCQGFLMFEDGDGSHRCQLKASAQLRAGSHTVCLKPSQAADNKDAEEKPVTEKTSEEEKSAEDRAVQEKLDEEKLDEKTDSAQKAAENTDARERPATEKNSEEAKSAEDKAVQETPDEKKDAADVTMLLNVVEGDSPLIRVRLEHLLKYQNYKKMKRVVYVDTRNETLSEPFVTLLKGLQSDGLIDSWLEVNYTKEYISQVRQKAQWETDFITQGHAGNLVYYHMLDTCTTTYCAHFDLDIAFWAKNEYSWIADGIKLLKSNPDALLVHPPKFGYEGQTIETQSTNVTDPDIPSTAYLCLDPTFMSARWFLVDIERYKQLLEEAKSSPKCGGNKHWEGFVSCNSCVHEWKRIDLTDTSAAKVMHFPMKQEAGLVDSILSKCWEKGVVIGKDNGFGGIIDPRPWQDHACMKNE